MMRGFSHWIRSRLHRGLFYIICILLCTGIFVVVHIRPGVRELFTKPNENVDEMITKSTQKQPNQVIDFDQSAIRNHTLLSLQTNHNPDRTRGWLVEAISLGRPLKPNEIVEDPLMVIIVGYLHTGSSYLGSVLQNSPGTFYQYEPLRNLRKQSRNNETAVYLNGTTRKVSGHYVDSNIAAEYVQHMLQCNHQKLDIVSLMRYFRKLDYQAMRDVRLFFACQNRPHWMEGSTKNATIRRQKRMKASFYTEVSQAKLRKCLPNLTNTCKRAKIRVLKLIRMRLDSAEPLLKQFPKLKVIHLFRDPRSMMDSQMRKNNEDTAKLQAFETETQRMCELMRNDIKQKAILMAEYPDNIIDFRYEDLARTPLEAIKSLFNFTGMSLTETNVDFIINTTVDMKKNSTVLETVWRAHMDQEHLDIVNAYCSDVLETLGYIRYKDISSIRDQANPTSR